MFSFLDTAVAKTEEQLCAQINNFDPFATQLETLKEKCTDKLEDDEGLQEDIENDLDAWYVWCSIHRNFEMHLVVAKLVILFPNAMRLISPVHLVSERGKQAQSSVKQRKREHSKE